MKQTNKITAQERDLIAVWRGQGISNKEIARRLGRHPSSIGREVQRNSFRGKHYLGLHAQARSERRKMMARKRHPLKNKDIYSYVLDKLRDGWSPEQIAGRLKKDHPEDSHWCISYETIYRFVHQPKNRHLMLWEYLRRKQKRRVTKGGRKAKKSGIPDRVSIHKRPSEVDRRKVPGHWEGDSIVGKGHRTGLHTEYERVSSLTRFERLNAVNSEETKQAMRKIFDPLPAKLKKSSTLDNGSEMVKHKTSGITCFFADPYSSWQRGGNENANLWIRYYFPKKTDFSTISDEELKDVENELNNRPRKRLNFATPNEVFNNYLKGCDSN